MRPLIFLLFIVLFFSGPAQAQYVPEENGKKDTTIVSTRENSPASSSKNSGGKFDWSKVVPGGNFALSFGNPYYIELSPMAGYMVSEKLMLGIGATYIGFGGTNLYGKFDWTIYGGRILGRHLLFDNVFANAELESLNIPYYFRGLDLQRKWITSPLVGGSYVYPFGNRGGLQATLLYNLNYQAAFSPYPSPLIWRIGFFF